MAWTEQQQTAIETRDCGLIVSAAAGSGKTSVLVERLLQILMDEMPERRVPADRIIVVTFTNDAAAEMRSRLYQALDLQLQLHPENHWLYQQQILLQSAHICTISSFCFELIRDNLTDQGLTSGFRILNETENQLIASKAADRVLNCWHDERPQEMKLLWDCFCEKNDTALERLLLELHSFLGAVPFRDVWCNRVLASFQEPMESSVYSQALVSFLQNTIETAVRLAEEAAGLAGELYDTVAENTVLPWVEEDLRVLNQLLQNLRRRDVPAEEMLAPLLEKKQNRGRRPFPRKKKSISDADLYERVKQIRAQYTELEGTAIALLESVFPYVSEDLEQHARLVPLLFAMEQELSEEIWQEKLRQNALGFEDGERLALELLSVHNEDGTIQPSPLAVELQNAYRLIMIDEYQDSNNKQDDIFKLLSHNCIDPQTGALRYGDNMFLVGDVKQSIYRFRLANPNNFISAMESASSENSVCQHIVLNKNFRSTSSILNFVNFICGSLMSKECGDVAYTKEESLQAGSALYSSLPETEQQIHIAILRHAGEDTEDDAAIDLQAEYFIRQIQQMIRQGTKVVQKDGTTRPCTYGDFCILLRKNAQCTALAHAMEAADIPVQSPDEKGYLQAREISILLDMLRVLDNPLLDTSLAAVMLSPMFWFSADDLVQIRMLAKGSSLYAALCGTVGKADQQEAAELPPELSAKCKTLYDVIQKLRQDSGMMTLEDLIRRIYDMTDFLSVMQLTKDGAQKRANLNLLLQYARQYEENTDASRGGVSGFLRYVDWLIESGKDFQQTSLSVGSDNAVAIKTMHRSKGLEYPFVFLGKLETPFSREDSKKNALFSDKGMVGFCIKNPETYTRAKTVPFVVLEQESQNQSQSEELRLLYVAMTRAKQQLFLPLQAEKIPLIQRNLLSYSTQITSDGRLPSALVQSAGSMAQWIWMCLLLRHDADLDQEMQLPAQHWETPAWSSDLNIHYTFSLPPKQTAGEQPAPDAAKPDPAITAELRQLAAFRYASEDCSRESILRASEIQEVKNKRPPVWNRPDFMQQKNRLTGAERGTAVHAFYQFADFSRAEQDISAEINRLQKRGFLTEVQAAAVSPEVVSAFFRDPIYQRLRHAKRVLREQMFTVQCRDLCTFSDAAAILERYQGSESVLRGIIDLAFQEEGAFVLIDYKTDMVSDSQTLLDSYREQIVLYRAALQCITNLPVKACYLYSTHLQKCIAVV